MNTPTVARRALFQNRNFRWLIGGGLLSMMGDQFTLLALPWLVLKLDPDPAMLGLVLALASAPRAVFILFGGALVDRTSPQRVLLLTKWANALLLGLLTAGVATHHISLAGVIGLSLLIGLATAFSYPAGSAIMPKTVPPELLQGANGALMGARQIVALLGPVLAGLLVSSGTPEAAAKVSDQGLALAFGFDALSFLISGFTLMQVRPLADTSAPAAPEPVLQAIKASLLSCWRDVELRTLMLYFAAIATLGGGPLQVALPLLASERLPGGAASLGLMLTALGLGSLAGMAIAGAKPNWRLKNLGATILLIDATAGCIFLPFGHITATWQGALMLLPLGAAGGYVQVFAFTWIQRRVPPAMMGRAMALFMFVVMGLAPISAAVAGAALRWLSVAELFGVAGASLIGVVSIGLLFTPMRSIRYADASA